jgi:hypothetical protein
VACASQGELVREHAPVGSCLESLALMLAPANSLLLSCFKRRRLPINHAFCAKCAEEDGKDLLYSFNFAFGIESPPRTRHTTGQKEADEDQPGSDLIPVVVRGKAAEQFLHGFHPKDVRNRLTTLDKLKRRLLPLLGSQIVYGHDEHQAQPFRFVLTTRAKKMPDGSIAPHYYLTSTRLVRDDAP